MRTASQASKNVVKASAQPRDGHFAGRSHCAYSRWRCGQLWQVTGQASASDSPGVVLWHLESGEAGGRLDGRPGPGSDL